MSDKSGKPEWDRECIVRNPSTKRNCPYSLYCAVCDMDDDDYIEPGSEEQLIEAVHNTEVKLMSIIKAGRRSNLAPAAKAATEKMRKQNEQ